MAKAKKKTATAGRTSSDKTKPKAARKPSPRRDKQPRSDAPSGATAPFACDVDLGPTDPASPAAAPESTRAGEHRLHRRVPGGFEGVDGIEYKELPEGANATVPRAANTTTWARVVRRELIGRHGSAPSDDPCAFHLRHFQVQPGGYSSFERHRHIHAVIVDAGRGEVRIHDEWTSLGPGDVVYVGPLTPHQFRCPADATQPLAFFCVVDATRDRPEELTDDSVAGAAPG